MSMKRFNEHDIHDHLNDRMMMHLVCDICMIGKRDDIVFLTLKGIEVNTLLLGIFV